MRNAKRFLSSLLAAVTLLLAVPAALAAESGFSDVTSGIWYTDAVNYVAEHNLMDPVSGNSFAPNAEANGVIAGYDDDRFGGDDPITREQIVAILWRYSGSPVVEQGQDFTDESFISAYASQAVDWSRANGIVNGYEDGRFGPQDHTTRAQLAVILRGYLTANQPSTGSRTLVVYYSATGSTQRVAGYIAEALNADTFELTPVNPYSSADLNWTDPSSRVNDEHDNTSLRDIALVSATPNNWADYDTVFIGYPIWCSIAAWPVDNFVKSNDFTGKTVIPFCTSSSSGLGQSGESLEEMAGTGDWQEGRRFPSGVSQDQVTSWVEGLK